MREAVCKMSVPTVAGYDVVRIGLGVLLLTAAALKGHQLATEPVAETGLLTSRWFLIGVVEFELFFGLWLLAGLYPKWTWRATLLCFGGFACVAWPSRPEIGVIRAFSFTSLLVWFCMAVGCSEQHPAADGAAKTGTSCRIESLDGRSPVVLEHDFGLVRPRKTLAHLFRIQNDSSERLVLESIRKTCTCTVAQASSKTIEPGEEESFEVLYKTGGRLGEKNQSLDISFSSGATTLCVELRVKAKVCLPLTPSPAKLTFGIIGRECPAVEIIKLQNFSARNWKSVAVLEAPAWLETDPAELLVDGDREADERSPRQVWSLAVRALTETLEPGMHQGEIVLEADGGKVKGTVWADIRIRDAVSAAPSLLMYGRIAPDVEVTKNVVVSFVSKPVRWKPEEVVIRNETGESIALEWRVLTDLCWQLKATLSAERRSRDERILDGSLVLEFPDNGLPSLRIPVHAMITGLAATTGPGEG